ncbi:MAG: hypothetical protein M3Q07_06835 [Pseudobdellovibrionaceae bacterium]|nr:hypothetical protein [Pseudobdellovibrionaceae bacterium]
MIKSMWFSAFGVFLMGLLCAPAQAEESSPPEAHPIYGGVIEFLYAQPTKSTNKRFSDFRDTNFGGGTYHSYQPGIRGRLNTGDGSGLDGRVFGEFTYLAADARRSYPGGNLRLQHRYMGLSVGVGGTWFITPMIAAYAEVSFLKPFKNEVRLSSGLGDVRYKSDFDDGSQFPWDVVEVGRAIGVDFRIDEPWLLILHYDYWDMGSGKVGGLHVGAGYAL